MKTLLILLFPTLVFANGLANYSPQGALNLLLKDSHVAAAAGDIRGIEYDTRYGYNLDLDTGVEETLWSQGGVYVHPTTARTVNFVSTDADDTAAGTGARTIRVFGIGSDGEAVTEDLTLNGTTPVPSTIPMRAVNRFFVLSAGSTSQNEGTITATQTVSNLVLASIPVGISINQGCIGVVPKGEKWVVSELQFFVIKVAGGASPDVTITSRIYYTDRNVNYNSLRASLDADANNYVTMSSPFTAPLPEGSVVSFRATSSVDNTQVACRMFYTSLPTE